METSRYPELELSIILLILRSLGKFRQARDNISKKEWTVLKELKDDWNSDLYKGQRNRCNLCRNFFVESKSFPSFHTPKKNTIYSRLSCDSKNVIYLASWEEMSPYTGSNLWNSLPITIKQITPFSRFSKTLKKYIDSSNNTISS